MEGSDRLVQVLSHHVPGGTEENHYVNHSQNIRCPGRNSMRPPSGYKSEDLIACANLFGITSYQRHFPEDINLYHTSYFQQGKEGNML